ncbi:MAG: trypsin-like peptidase domain-containing protein [Pirellulales bacterium]|nr:trypsin-like peptidase domain-containing protein [Pirellulales bacterium]
MPHPGVLGPPAPLPAVDVDGIPWNLARSVFERPHPAVARIVVPEGEMTSYGSGTLVDVRDDYGLVVTNWHVVRDSRGEVEVIFPDGFRSKARPLKVDPDWDLAALIIWRPAAEPVRIADSAPQPGDVLTICGYGSGQYRAATGRCTQYYAPALDLPQHMVELDVEARQGDSGGPILNAGGELAGVLFGAGQGTTMGSFGGRVESFLASLAPDIGRPIELAAADQAPRRPASETAVDPAAQRQASASLASASPRGPVSGALCSEGVKRDIATLPADKLEQDTASLDARPKASVSSDWHTTAGRASMPQVVRPSSEDGSPQPIAGADWLDTARNILAVIGGGTLAIQLARFVR